MAKKDKEERVYKRIELIGVSSKGFEDAIEAAVRRASTTISGLRWFEVKETRGAIANGKVTEYQVVLVASFEVQD